MISPSRYPDQARHKPVLLLVDDHRIGPAGMGNVHRDVVGPVAVRAPRVRDRGADEPGSKIRFTSAILPPYLRRTKSIEELLPWLYLKGISTGDFSEALAALLGPEAPGKGSWSIGNGAISRPGATSTSGPTVSTSRHDSITTSNASW